MTDLPAPGAQLATFAAQLNAQAIPTHVLRKTEDLLVDWFGSALAGKGARPVETIGRFAARMGAGTGASHAGRWQRCRRVLTRRPARAAVRLHSALRPIH